MSHIVVMTFDNEEEASNVREALKKVQHQGNLSLDDSAIVVKDADGKVHVKNELDRGVKVGGAVGGLLGLFVALLTAPIGFPLIALTVGIFGGAGVGSLTDMGIQKSFVKDVSNALKPATSALFIIIRSGNPNAAIAALKPYKGEVYHTSFEADAEDSLRNVLSKRTDTGTTEG